MEAVEKPHILLVEDDRLIRCDTAESLRDHGYVVSEVSGAAEAIQLLMAEPFDLVFTDVILPGSLSGIDLVNWIRKNRPDIKIGVTSGSISAVHAAFPLCGPSLVFPKPYETHQVAQSFARIFRGREMGTARSNR